MNTFSPIRSRRAFTLIELLVVIAIKRLEAGEDPEKIEADMGDVLGDFMGGNEGGAGDGGYTHDSGLYDF